MIENILNADTHTIDVEITQQDLDQGKRFLSCACPLALALARTLDVSPLVLRIGAIWAFRTDDHGRLVEKWTLTESAKRFCLFWNTGGPMEPCTVRLTLEAAESYPILPDFDLPTKGEDAYVYGKVRV